jgi:hypothetical protein
MTHQSNLDPSTALSEKAIGMSLVSLAQTVHFQGNLFLCMLHFEGFSGLCCMADSLIPTSTLTTIFMY